MELNEILRKLDSLSLQVDLLMSRGISGGASDPSPTPTTLGALARETISTFNGCSTVSKETFPDANVEPFLNTDEMTELRQTSFSNKSDLVKWFQPHFRRLMDTVSTDVGFKMILLNTERHPWVLCPHRGAPSKTDGVGIAAELASLRVARGDEPYQNRGDTNFGRLANWVLRDSIEFISKWKVGENFNQGLGEGIEYHRRINSSFVSDRQLQDSTKTTDIFVANEAGFHLVRCFNGDARFIYESGWDSPCSKHALHLFASGRLWQTPRKRIWKDAITKLCTKFEVELADPSERHDCFLGYGSSGRVFRVLRDGDAMVLKVSIGDVNNANSEIAEMKLHKERLRSANVTSCLVKSCIRFDEKYAGLLIAPIGRPLQRQKGHISAALCSLRKLHRAGFAHRDSRWPNAIMVGDDTCRWIDLRTLEDLKEESMDYREDAFVADIATFVHSFGVTVDKEKLRQELGPSFLHSNDSDPPEEILDEISAIWQRQPRTT